MLIMELLPVGLAGIVIAAYIAAVMSTADSVLMGPVAIVTNDIYRRYFRPNASEQSIVMVARIATLVLGVLGIGMACAVTALPILILLMEKLELLRQPIGQRILRYASLDDIAIWGVLALILMDWNRVGR